MIAKWIQQVKLRWSCSHRYRYFRSYHRESYYDDARDTMVYPLGFIVECQGCGKVKDASEAWCRKHDVENMPEIVVRILPRQR